LPEVIPLVFFFFEVVFFLINRPIVHPKMVI
jgi:hypothetical protein